MVLYLRKVALREEATGSKFALTKYMWVMPLKLTINDKRNSRMVKNKYLL